MPLEEEVGINSFALTAVPLYIENPYHFQRKSMLRRLVSIWLMVSILGYGLALAGDFHGKPLAGNAVTHDHPGDPAPAADNDCGHCSHGLQHLLGLESRFDFPVPQFKAPLYGDAPVLFTTPPLRLIQRPPISA